MTNEEAIKTIEADIHCINSHIFFSDTANAKERATPAERVETLNDRYGVFVYQDIIVFEKWED